MIQVKDTEDITSEDAIVSAVEGLSINETILPSEAPASSVVDEKENTVVSLNPNSRSKKRRMLGVSFAGMNLDEF